MSFKQYRIIDIVLFIVIYGICEFGIIKVDSQMIDQPYIVSLILPMMLIVLIRWDKHAIYQAIASAILFVLFQKGDIRQMIVYLSGNLGLMLLAMSFRKYSKERITSSAFNCSVYVAAGLILMEVFRYIGILIIYHSDIGALVRLLATDSLTGVFSIVVILIVRKMDGLLMDQKSYLLQLQEERKTEQSGEYE